MKRLPHVAMLLVAVALVAADKGEKKKGDAEKIQGKWTIVESFYKGKKSVTTVASRRIYTFSGKKPIVGDGKVMMTFELRPEKKPHELDLILSVLGTETTCEAIYELSGDKLKICHLFGNKPRPEAMGTGVDDERYLMVLKRVKGDDKKITSFPPIFIWHSPK